VSKSLNNIIIKLFAVQSLTKGIVSITGMETTW